MKTWIKGGVYRHKSTHQPLIFKRSHLQTISGCPPEAACLLLISRASALCLGAEIHCKHVVWKTVLAAFHFYRLRYSLNFVFCFFFKEVLMLLWMPVVWAVTCYPRYWPATLRLIFGASVCYFVALPFFGYKHFLCPIWAGFGVPWHTGFHACFYDYLPFPWPCCENTWAQGLFFAPHLLLSIYFGLLLSLINSLTFSFSSLLLLLEEKGGRGATCLTALPWLPCFSLEMHLPSTSRVAGLVTHWSWV